ncbi:MAG: esterase [Burkholderiaceae bacterium]|nr:esterase [Burkholderiaceae bacterium]
MTPRAAPLLPDTLQWLPAAGRAEQLMILLHGWGAGAAAMAPLAQALRVEFPQAALLAPEGFEAAEGLDDGAPAGRQWFAMRGADGPLSDANRPARVAAVLPRLAGWVRAAQAATGVGPAATALVGFSQGAVVALELAQLHDGLAGRVLSFAGRYATLPERALAQTTLHFFHGADDAVIPAAQARLAMQRLAALHGDATIDIASGVGHELPAALLRCAIGRLRSHIPHRTWAAALGAVPGLAQRQARGDDE